MATYIAGSDITITRQEGDTADLQIFVPSVIDISTFDIHFSVFTYAGTLLFKKELTDWVKDGQLITANITEGDTVAAAGNHRWELEISNPTNIYTIGRGNFVIKKQLIKDRRH